MFGNFWNALKTFFASKPLQVQFEQMLLDEAAKNEKKETTIVVPPVVDEAPKDVVITTEEVIRDVVVTEDNVIDLKTETIITDAFIPGPVLTTNTVNTQITDAVTAVKPKRAKSAKGKFVADDKSTPDVNEAWVGGKAPAKVNNPKRGGKRKKK